MARIVGPMEWGHALGKYHRTSAKFQGVTSGDIGQHMIVVDRMSDIL